MEQTDVIAPVDEPTDWVNSLVITEKKNGSLRLCLDPKDLNKNIRRELFQLPTFDDVITRLGGKKVFTILDLKDSYWQVKLDESSSRLCTFNTPFGRYRFKRMPFGITSASEILQKRAYKAFGDIEGVHIIADDMLLAADNDSDHDQIMRKVLERARSQGVRFNFNKLQFKLPEVFYMGRRIGKDGVRPDVAKVKAIVEMPDPQDREGVQRLLGMLNFLAPFIPNMSTLTSPIRSLLKSEVPWQWLPEHKEAMKKLKETLSNNPVLRLYDPKLPMTIQADASSTGLGACLMQKSQPMAYASRALSDAETRYAQIERELLAIVYAVEQFHLYIYGREVEVESDHRPLETIVRKPIQKASPRLQLMLLRLLRYKLAVKYVPGSKMYIADTLSRAYIPDKVPNEPDEMRIHSMSTCIPATPERIQAIREATEVDPVLQKVQQYTSNGWPSHKGTSPPDIQPYWAVRFEIHEDDGMMFVGEKLIIPASLKNDILGKLHESHLGMDKCKARARESMYWPNMNRDIEEVVGNCATCANFKRQNSKEPLLPHSVPDRPWSKLGADLFDFGGKDHLLVVDYFSKYPEVARLDNKTASGVIKALKPIFARHGIPDTLVSDNMPFASHTMKEFAKDWGFSLVTSSPTYAQSNGQSEKFVGTMKTLLRKAGHVGQDPNIALLEYRNTPVSGMLMSPAQLLMSRRLKDKLPTAAKLLNPAIVQNPQKILIGRQRQQKRFYDRGAKPLRKHNIGDSVRVRLGKTWDPAVIVEEHPAPRSYRVTTQDGQTYRRNRKFINRSPDTVHIMPPSMDGGDERPRPPAATPPASQPVPPAARVTAEPTFNTDASPRRSERKRSSPHWHKDYNLK
jgi:hypothetical protein